MAAMVAVMPLSGVIQKNVIQNEEVTNQNSSMESKPSYEDFLKKVNELGLSDYWTSEGVKFAGQFETVEKMIKLFEFSPEQFFTSKTKYVNGLSYLSPENLDNVLSVIVKRSPEVFQMYFEYCDAKILSKHAQDLAKLPLVTLMIDNVKNASKEDLEQIIGAFCENKNVTQIFVRGNPDLTDSAIVKLPTKIHELYMSSGNLTNKGLVSLTYNIKYHNTSLAYLEIEKSKDDPLPRFTPDGVRQFVEFVGSDFSGESYLVKLQIPVCIGKSENESEEVKKLREEFKKYVNFKLDEIKQDCPDIPNNTFDFKYF
jgi:hypothetical protein